MKKIVNGLLILATLGVLGAVVGCGGGASDDAGTEFSLVGFYKDGEGESGSSGTFAALDNQVGVTTFAQFQNNLQGSAIRLNSVRMSYVIPGAISQPPDDSFALGGVLGAYPGGQSSLPPGLGGPANDGINPASSPAAGGSTGGSTGSTTGGSGTAVPNSTITEFMVVPLTTIQWLRANYGVTIPAGSFILEAYVTANGKTTAGKDITSNTAPFFIQFVPGSLIPEDDDSSSSSVDETVDEALVE